MEEKIKLDDKFEAKIDEHYTLIRDSDNNEIVIWHDELEKFMKFVDEIKGVVDKHVLLHEIKCRCEICKKWYIITLADWIFLEGFKCRKCRRRKGMKGYKNDLKRKSKDGLIRWKIKWHLCRRVGRYWLSATMLYTIEMYKDPEFENMRKYMLKYPYEVIYQDEVTGRWSDELEGYQPRFKHMTQAKREFYRKLEELKRRG